MRILFFSVIVFLSSIAISNIPEKIFSNHSLVMAAQPPAKSPDIRVIKVTLLAREEKTPPFGEPVNPQRDIGFASVFIRLKNLRESDSKIMIQKITIVNLHNSELQKFSFFPKEIILHPLENSELVFHLKNKTGYSTTEPVKAIVTYQIGHVVSEIDSDLTEVNRP